MGYTAYSTHQLLEAVRNVPRPNMFWLDWAFRQQVNFTSKSIDFDKIDRGRRLAPFVAPSAQGKVMSKEGYLTRQFEPAYLKPKHVVEPDDIIVRMAGEQLAGSMSLAARRDAKIMELMTLQREMVMRRWNLMAAQAVIDGQITVVGDDFPEVTIAFGRDANQTVTLTGGDLWTDTANSTPYADLENFSTDTARLSGYGITDFLMGTSAWSALAAHPDTEKLLNTNLRSGDTSLSLGPAQTAEDGSMIQLKGTTGAFRIWLYSDIYQNDAGTNTEILSADTIVGLNPGGLQGVRCFGAILDPRAGYQAVDIYSKNWINEDPAAEYVMSQSAPLMVPKEPNASMKAKVV